MLTGTVFQREDKRRAEDMAERISGVKDVRNNLRVSSEQSGERSGQGQEGSRQGQQNRRARQGSQPPATGTDRRAQGRITRSFARRMIDDAPLPSHGSTLL